MKNTTHDKAYRAFVARLKLAREESGLTQVEVAKKLGQPQSYVSKCETGEKRVDVIELVRFARLYQKEVGFFLPNEK